ncbi:alpha-amylase family protein [Sphingobacterium hungaricum]
MRYVLCFLLMYCGVQSALATEISFGKNGKINYDTESGTFSFSNDGFVWLKDAFSSATVNGIILDSKGYKNRTYSKVPFKDASGKGIKHIFKHTDPDLPDLEQHFFVFDNKDYVLVALEFSDTKKILTSNHLIPIRGVLQLKNQSEYQSLLAPFDNDTFISFDSKKIKSVESVESAEVGALYHENSKNGFVIGSVEQQVWKSGIVSSKLSDNQVNLEAIVGFTQKDLNRDDMPHGSISGSKISSAKIFVGQFSDWREGMNAFALQTKALQTRVVHAWKEETPVAWNSWGVMQTALNYDKILKVTDFFADSVKNLPTGQSVYIDLDSYWDNLLKGGLEGDYSKLKEFADYVKSKGLKPGIYWAPFTDWGFAGGGERRVEGSDATYGEAWTKVKSGYHDIDGARAMDPTHPATQKRIALVISKMKECGFEMIKIDFLGHAAIESTQFADPNVSTGMQAYRVGMDYLIQQLDGKMLVYAAISPSLATAPYVHVRRIACDAFSSIKDTRYTLNSTTYGWWQTHLYDYVDADHVVFKDASTEENIARFYSALVTGTVVFGDDFSISGKWNEQTKKLFNQTDIWSVIQDGKAFVPLHTDEYASPVFIKKQKGEIYVALFNYDENEKNISLSNAWLGLDKNASYQLVDLMNGSVLQLSDQIDISISGKNAKLVKLKKL